MLAGAVRSGLGGWSGQGAQPAPPAAATVSAAAPVTAGGGFRVGQAVFHNRFGEGVVLSLEGRGEDARAQVRFHRHGTKWLALAVAKLTPVDS